MKSLSKLLTLATLAATISSCNSIGHQFCLNSGHSKDSVGYKQCTASYEANRDFYQYCQNKKAVVAEGSALNQCVSEARDLQNNFQKDNSFCKQEADRKFSSVTQKPKEEKQATLTDNGDVVVGNIVLNAYYSPGEKTGLTAPYVNSCMSAHGWINTTSWQEGKRSPSMSEITSALSNLNKGPVIVNTPEHPTVKLFTAVADGNVYQVKNIINGGVNVDSTNHQGYTALHVAARRGNFHIVQALLEELGANLDTKSNKGEDAIAMASYGRQPAIVNYLTEFMKKKEREKIADEQQKQMILIQKTQENGYCRVLTGHSDKIVCRQPDGSWRVQTATGLTREEKRRLEDELNRAKINGQSTATAPSSKNEKKNVLEKELEKAIKRW